MNPSNMRPGALVRNPGWSESVHVCNVDRVNPYMRVMGRTTESGMAVDIILTQDAVRRLETVDGPTHASGSSQRAFLAIESLRYGLASADDALSALHSSSLDILPHQIEAVYGYALQWPRVRFMLAHISGAGKTIMAGLITKELVARQAACGVLVVAPKHLHEHWRREMARFGEDPYMADRDAANHIRRSWNLPGIAIASSEFIEREDVMPYIESAPPDVIVVDAAHTLPLQSSPKSDKRLLSDILSDMSKHLLLLTATPPPTDSPQFRHMLDMLRSGFLAGPDMIQESTDAADNPLFLRRTAGTITNMAGNRLFNDRIIKTLYITPSEIEILFYDAVGDHMKKWYKQNIARSMCSGVYAALHAMETRIRNIKDALHDYPKNTTNSEDAEAEIKSLDRLIMMARRVLDSNSEHKVLELRRALKGLEGAQALIVTESAHTLQYLQGKVSSWGYEVSTLSDDMNHVDRVLSEASFRAGADVMISTDMASEGMNLQFCGNMINYDIPWEPDQISRRLGYLRRFGNDAGVSILNMVVADTPQGILLKSLLDFLERIRDETGSDTIFDYAGQAISSDALLGIMDDITTGAKPDIMVKGMLAMLEEWYQRDGCRAISEEMEAPPMDLAALSRIAEDSRTRNIFPEYIQDVIGRTLDMLGGKVRQRPDGFGAIDYIPSALRDTVAGTKIPDGYYKITFDSSQAADADMVAPGHPLYEAVFEWITEECAADAKRGTVFTDPDGKMDGYILFHELEIRDGAGGVAGRKIVTHYMGRKGGKATHVHPSILWDMKPDVGNPDRKEFHAAEMRSAPAVFAASERYRDELLMERRQLGEVQERYGLASLDGLVQDLVSGMKHELDSDKLHTAALAKARYEKHREELAASMPYKQEMVMCTPHMVAWVRIIPGSADAPDPRIHMSGIKMAMAHERRSGRLPVNMSGHHMGYDIESRDAEGRARYIAVRAREGIGGVSITPNELRVARNTGQDYYLYIIYDGDLVRVPNPGYTLTVRRGDIRHAISVDDIQNHAEQDP